MVHWNEFGCCAQVAEADSYVFRLEEEVAGLMRCASHLQHYWGGMSWKDLVMKAGELLAAPVERSWFVNQFHHCSGCCLEEVEVQLILSQVDLVQFYQMRNLNCLCAPLGEV